MFAFERNIKSSLSPGTTAMTSVFITLICMSVLFPYLKATGISSEREQFSLVLSILILCGALGILLWLHTKSNIQFLPPEKVLSLPYPYFDRYIAALLAERGFTQVTWSHDENKPRTTFTGYKDGVKILIQLSRDMNPVDSSDIQNVRSQAAHIGTQKSLLICEQNLTSSIRKCAQKKGIDIMGKKELLQWITDYARSTMV